MQAALITGGAHEESAYAIIFSQDGLMAGIGSKGSKISKKDS